MGQMGFFDVAQRYAGLDAKQDPLLGIDALVPWESFRGRLEAVWRKPAAERKSKAGRKPWDAVVMFKAIVLCELYNLSDDQVEYQLRDRLSFVRFLGLGLEDPVPDAKTVWLYREQLAEAGVIEALFDDFDGHLKREGYLAMGGQIVDASIVPVPKQRNSRDDNAKIKAGETPEGWAEQPAKRAQKDTDARWTKKHGQSHFGYKNHVNVDRRHKLIRRYQATSASVHDSQVVDDVLDPDNTASDALRGLLAASLSGVGSKASWPSMGGQCLPLGGDRGEAGREGPEEPHPPQGPSRPAARRTRAAGQPDALQSPRARRARVRCPVQRHGRNAGTQHRPGPRQGPDRAEEPCLQHAPPGSAGTRHDGSPGVTDAGGAIGPKLARTGNPPALEPESLSNRRSEARTRPS